MRKSRLSKAKHDKLLEHFVAGTTGRCAAELVDVHRKTSAYYFQRLREIIAYHIEQETHEVVGVKIEVDESYFGGVRKGKRGRCAGGKVAVFGLLKRGERVYTKIIPAASAKTLMPIIERKVVPDSIVYSDYWYGYNALDVSDLNTAASITQSSLLTSIIISTALKIFAIKPSVTCANLRVYQRNNLGYF